MKKPRGGWVIFLVAPVLLAAYSMTWAPGAWWGDGLELAAAAKVLGVPHPTGYPLYILLGHAAIESFGFIDPGQLLTIMSALFCSLAASQVGLAVASVRSSIDHVESPGEQPPAIGNLHSTPWLMGAGAAFIFGVSRTVWEHATFAEVYPLTWLLGAAILLLVCARPVKNLAPRTVLLGSLCGLATLNHYSILALAPLAVCAVFSWGKEAKRSSSLVLLFVLGFGVWPFGYGLVLLRASANPEINWGDPSTLQRLLWMLRGGDYIALNAPNGFAEIFDGGRYWLEWLGRQFLPAELHPIAFMPVGLVLYAGAISGCWSLAKRRRSLAIGLLAIFFVTFLFAVLYPIPDRDAYLVPALPAVILGWLQLARLGKLGTAESLDPKRPQVATILVSLGAAIGLIVGNGRSIDKSGDNGPKLWAGHVLQGLPPDALVLTRQAHDSEIYALWYEQIVNGTRPDVTVFGTGFIFSGWYRKYFEVEGRPKIQLFITDREPGSKEIYDIALVGGVIAPNAGKRRIFMTAGEPDEMDPTIRQLNPVPFAELLPKEYYDHTAYKLNPPGRILVELKPDENLLRIAKERFRETFDQEPPS